MCCVWCLLCAPTDTFLIAPRFSTKTKFASLLVYSVVVEVLVAFLPPGFSSAIPAAAATSATIAGWYAIDYAGFTSLVPPRKEASWVALHQFSGFVIRYVTPATFSAIVQSTNNYQFAILVPPAFNCLALLVLLCINFERGEKAAGRGAAVAAT